MALSVSGFPEPLRGAEPNADPSTSSTQEGSKNAQIRIRGRFFGSQMGLKDSLIHPQFSHTPLQPLYPTADAESTTFAFDALSGHPPPPFFNTHPFSVHQQHQYNTERMTLTHPPPLTQPTTNLIPTFVSSGDSDYHTTDARQQQRVDVEQPLPTIGPPIAVIPKKRSFLLSQAVLSPLPHHPPPRKATPPVRIPGVGTSTTRRDAALVSSFPKFSSTPPARITASEPTLTLSMHSTPTPRLPSPAPTPTISPSTVSINSPGPIIPTFIPTTTSMVESAPSKSPGGSGGGSPPVSLPLPDAKPNITINTTTTTTGLSSSPTFSSYSYSSHLQLHHHHHHQFHQQQQQQQPAHKPPSSCVLIPAAETGSPASNLPQSSTINLRYQSMTIVDPSGSAQASSSSSSSKAAKSDMPTAAAAAAAPLSSTRTYKVSQTRIRRPKQTHGNTGGGGGGGGNSGTRANTLEAIPLSWASASRPSDLRPQYPNQPQSHFYNKTGRKSVSRSPPPPVARSTAGGVIVQSSRSKSVDRNNGANPRVIGPRSPKFHQSGIGNSGSGFQLAQPAPQKLSLAMVMDTTKLVSSSPPSTSILGSSSISSKGAGVPRPTITTATTATVKVLPIRSTPSSPTASPSLPSHTPAFTRLPISGSPEYALKRETSPPPPASPFRALPISPSTFRAAPRATATPPPLPSLPPVPNPTSPILSRSIPPTTTSSSSPSFRSVPPLLSTTLPASVPLSPLISSSLPSPYTPKTPPAIAVTSPTTATTSTLSPLTPPPPRSSDLHKLYNDNVGLKEKEDGRDSRPSSPMSALSYASIPISSRRDIDDTLEEEKEDTYNLSYPIYINNPLPLPRSTEEQYNDQLVRIPLTPTSTSPSSGSPTTTTTTTATNKDNTEPVLEVFIDNLYYDELERSPSPILYARPGGGIYSDSDSGCDDLGYGVESGARGVHTRRRRRRRRRQQEEDNKSSLGMSGGVNASGSGSSHTPPRHVNKERTGGGGAGVKVVAGASSGKRPKRVGSGPSSPISYHSDDSSLFYGTRPRPSRRRTEQLRSYRYSFRPPPPGTTLTPRPGQSHTRMNTQGSNESPRSPSPISYAPRRSMDFLYDSDSGDDSTPDITGTTGGRAARRVVLPPRDTVLGFLTDDAFNPNRRVGTKGGGRHVSAGRTVQRRTVQPRSFLHDYSTPPDIQPFPQTHAPDTDKDESPKEKPQRGRKRERSLIPMPLVNYGSNKEKEREKEKEKDKKEEKMRTRKGSRGILDELAAVTVLNAMAGRKVTGTVGSTESRSRSPKQKNKEKEAKEKEKDREREKDGQKDGQKEEKKRKWVWDLKSESTKDKSERTGESSTSGSTASGTWGEGALESQEVLDIGVGREHWNEEWEENGKQKKRRQRHSLAGLEFL